MNQNQVKNILELVQWTILLFIFGKFGAATTSVILFSPPNNLSSDVLTYKIKFIFVFKEYELYLHLIVNNWSLTCRTFFFLRNYNIL